MYCSTILKLIIFFYSPFSDSLSLSHVVSLLIPLSTMALSSRLSLITSPSHGGRFWRGPWVRRGGETRKSDRRAMVAIFGYVLWVHGYAALWYGGLRRRVHGFPEWFAATRSVCNWVFVNFDLIFFCGSSCGFEICYWFDLILEWIFFVGSWWWSWGLPWWWW